MKFSLKPISLRLVQRRGVYLWVRYYRVFFLLVFLVLTVGMGYQWYRNLYRYQWTESERQAYLESTAKETVFQEKKFLRILERLDEDRAAHATRLDIPHDLFSGAREKSP